MKGLLDGMKRRRAVFDGRVLLLICLIIGVGMGSMIMTRQVVPLYLESLGASSSVLGLVVASFALLPLFIALPGGYVMDRVGYRSMIVLGAVFMSVSSFALVWMPPIPWVVLSQMVGGLASILVILSTQAYVSNLGAPRDRARNFALYSLAFGIGLLLGPPLVGVINDRFGYAMSFMASGAIASTVILMGVALPRLKHARWDGNLLAGIRVGWPTILETSRKLVARPGVRISLGVSMCVLFVMSVRSSFYLVFLENLGFSATLIGLLVAVQEGISLIFRPLLPRLLDRFGPLNLLFASFFFGAVGMGLTSLGQSFLGFAVAAMFYGLTPAFSQPISMLLMSQNAERERMGMAMGLRQAANQLPLLFGPIILGLIGSWLGLRSVFVVTTVVLLAALTWLVGRRSVIASYLKAPVEGEVDSARLTKSGA